MVAKTRHRRPQSTPLPNDRSRRPPRPRSFVSNGLLTWLPTLYTTVYHLPVGEALTYTLSRTISSFPGAFVCIALIDRIGRRPLFTISFVGTAVPLLILAASGPVGSPVLVMILSGVPSLFSTAMPIGVYVYVPEIDPTRMRALGAGVASSWLRIATIVAPSKLPPEVHY